MKFSYVFVMIFLLFLISSCRKENESGHDTISLSLESTANELLRYAEAHYSMNNDEGDPIQIPKSRK